MKEQLKKDFSDLVTMGKGAISLGEEKLKEVTESEGFKNFNNDLNNEISKLEVKGKQIKEDLMNRGKAKEQEKNQNKD